MLMLQKPSFQALFLCPPLILSNSKVKELCEQTSLPGPYHTKVLFEEEKSCVMFKVLILLTQRWHYKVKRTFLHELFFFCG